MSNQQHSKIIQNSFSHRLANLAIPNSFQFFCYIVPLHLSHYQLTVKYAHILKEMKLNAGAHVETQYGVTSIFEVGF